MMRIALLLLVTLAGPFCTFTQASTLVVPTSIDTTPESNLGTNLPEGTAQTEKTVAQDAVSTPAPTTEATEAAASTKEGSVASTAAPVIQSEAPLETTTLTDTTQTTEAVAPAPEETDAPENTTSIEPSAEPKDAVETQSEPSEVEMDNEGMGTGQLAGIVIGALITVIIVIAVIILVVRRMGQYSP
ncbi:podoplanin [Garra rufa]|uniref:podoplanin n=1 Tax=Garra rufa TaxID=137080 RepID=UPI003CCE9C54